MLKPSQDQNLTPHRLPVARNRVPSARLHVSPIGLARTVFLLLPFLAGCDWFLGDWDRYDINLSIEVTDSYADLDSTIIRLFAGEYPDGRGGAAPDIVYAIPGLSPSWDGAPLPPAYASHPAEDSLHIEYSLREAGLMSFGRVHEFAFSIPDWGRYRYDVPINPPLEIHGLPDAPHPWRAGDTITLTYDLGRRSGTYRIVLETIQGERLVSRELSRDGTETFQLPTDEPYVDFRLWQEYRLADDAVANRDENMHFKADMIFLFEQRILFSP